MDLRSRMVALLKVLLPLAALAILSTLFLLSRSIDPTATIPFAGQDMADRLSGQQITAPFYSGTTAQGDEILATASLARPGGENQPAEATALRVRVNMADGVRLTMESDSGTIGADSDVATFSGNVQFTSSAGYVITTDRLNTDLNGLSGDTPGPIKGKGPLGAFDAGRMRFRSESEGGPLHLHFNKGVKLIYRPPKTER